MPGSKKISAQMSTSIALDTLKAAENLKSLQTAISGTTSAWKAQSAALQSAGREQDALKAKINGLKEVQEIELTKIEALKQKQQDLDLTTQKGAQQYTKYQSQIDRLNATYEKQTTQIDKAQQSLNYYSSGLGKLQNEYQQSNRLSEAYVERLRAEGNQERANKEIADQLTKNYANLSKQYSTQKEELNTLNQKQKDANEVLETQKAKLKYVEELAGKTSTDYQKMSQAVAEAETKLDKANNAYNEQSIRLQKTATEMAKTKTQSEKLNEELEKKHPSFLAKVKENLDKTQDKTTKLSLSTAKMFAANALSNGLSSALSALHDKFSDLIQQGNQYLDYEQKMNATWLTLTGNAQKGKEMVNTINQLATSAQNSTEMVDGLAKQFYAVTQNKDKTMELSKSVLTLQDAFGASDDAVQNFAQQYSQMVANGKASAQDFLSFTNVFPQMKQNLLEYEKTITHNTKMTTADLNQMISDGKVSAEDMNKVLIDMGKKYQDATQNFTNTIPGLKRTIDATMPQLIGAIEQPFYKMKNPILGSLSKAVTDPSIKTEVGKLGKTLSDALNDVMNAFGGGKSFNGVTALKGVLKDVEGAVKKTATTLVEHKQDIKDFMGVMSQTSVATWKVFADTLKILEPAISAVAKAAAAHPKAFATMASGMMAMNVAAKALRSPLMLVVNALLSLGNNAGKVKTKLGGLKTVFSSLHTKMTPLIGKVKELATTLGGKLVSGLSKLLPIGKNVLNMFKSMGAFFLTNPFGIAITAIVGIGTALTALYKHNAKFRKFVNDMVKSVKDWANSTLKSIGNWAKNFPNKIKDACISAGKHMKDGWDKMKGAVSDGVRAITDKNSKMHDEMISKISDATGVSKKTLNDGYNVMDDYTQTWKDLMSGKWSKLHDDLTNTTKDLKKVASDIFSGMYDKLNDLTHGGLDKIREKWDDLWEKIKTGIKNAVKNVGNSAVDMVNGVIEPINGMIKGTQKGINWVLDKFGASKVSFGTIPKIAHFAKGGEVGKDGQFAVVNDSGTTNYREMFATPDGRFGMFPKQRDFMTFLPKGTQILDGENSKVLADMLNIPHFKDGTKNKNLFEKIFDKGKDILDDIKDVIAHPLEFLSKVFTKHIDTKGKGWTTNMIAKAPSYFAKQGINWVKKLAEDFKKKKEEENSVAGISSKNIGKGAGNWREVIEKVAKATHTNVSESDMNALLARIQKESGGDQSIKQQIDDVNSRNGNPAQGLFQYIPPTFAAWAVPGHTNILSGEDQIYAVFNDSNWRSDIRMPGGWGPTGHKVFANGGFVNEATKAIIGEAGPEVVIPLDSSKQGRALSLLTATVNKLNRNAGNKSQVVTNTDTSGLESKLDTMITLLSGILGVNKEQLNKGNGVNFNQFYQQMQRDQSMNDYQAF